MYDSESPLTCCANFSVGDLLIVYDLFHRTDSMSRRICLVVELKACGIVYCAQSIIMGLFH